jgi:DNA replication licensing factor MCM5
VDFQTLKLQENPEDVPQGEMPRHLQLFCDRYLTDRVAPGNRVTVMGVYSIKRANQNKKGNKDNVGLRAPYLRVLGIEVEASGPGRNSESFFTADEEEYFRNLAKQPNIYETIAKSIAPSIYGSEDIKKAIACLLFGGSRKRMPDGLTRRGDINVLLLGDPGTAKSQLLKFVEKVSPIGVYTSGKGSSAAGLTAAVIRDTNTKGFIMEGGAMVLADGGVVCIDEFDKMREDDRVAIHEAMEQQTISIAKAGITTTLNSRCSVLAAANSIFGRWDDSKGDDNIDFMPTILSRFDMIFLVKDEHSERRDMTLAKHVMNVHMNAYLNAAAPVEGELSLGVLKKYIHFCKSRCAPRLSPSAAETLKHKYVKMREDCFRHQQDAKAKSAIPITVRQLEAIIRISEALAKMELSPFATERHVEEAARLFHVSTLEAAKSGSLAGAEGFTSEQDHEMMGRIEKQLKRRFAIGTQVSEHAVLQEFQRQNYPEHAVFKVLHCMIRRGEIQHRLQRKMLYRVK